MTIKSFFADTVAAAIREARKELGEEAMLLKSRRAPDDCRRLGAYEVVFGVVQPVSSEEPAEWQGIWEVPSFAAGQEPERRRASRLPDAGGFYRRLIDLDFDERMAAELVERVEARLLAEDLPAPGASQPHLSRLSDDDVARAISQELDQFFPRDFEAGDDSAGCTMALIGPPGGGKTSTVIRLAVAHGLASGRRVVLLAAHDHRVAATSKLRHYASLLGVEIGTPERPEDLREQLERRSEKDLTLIDTPGYAPSDIEQGRALAGFLAGRQDIQKHLVLPASMKAEDLSAAVQRFEGFGTDRLLFTRLDETSRLGSVFSLAAASRKPVSFLTTGQQVPGDILPAYRFSLLSLLEQREKSMLTAA